MLHLLGRRFPLQKATRLTLRALSAQGKCPNVQKNEAPVISGNVAGLSEKCMKIPNQPVGPGASKDKEYKNPEYFCYHIETFAEAEVELARFRLPAPSNKRPFQT